MIFETLPSEKLLRWSLHHHVGLDRWWWSLVKSRRWVGLQTRWGCVQEECLRAETAL